MIKTHKFPDAAYIELKYQHGIERMKMLTAALESPTGDRLYSYRGLANESRWSGASGLLLQYSDEVVRRHFADAVKYGLCVLAEATHSGVPLAIHYFHESLMVVIAFGDASACRTFATFPEERYQSPNVIPSPTYFPLMRAYKACVLGDAATARLNAEAVHTATPKDGLKAQMQALLALMSGDGPAFHDNLDQVLAAHKKNYAREQNNQDGYVCWTALMLCRLAKVQGIAVADDGYLPAHLVPADPVR